MAVVTGSIAAGAALTKLGIGAKLMAALKGAGGLVGLGSKGAAAATAAKAAGTRMAGQGLLGAAKSKLGANFAKAFAVNPATGGRGIVGSVLPDVGFGVLTGVMTPGDLGDKVLAGTTDAVIGAGLTGGLRGAVGAKAGSALGNTIEIGGGALSGFAAQPVIDSALRIKGGGQSPYDKLQTEQYAAMRSQIEQDIMSQLMSGSRVPYVGDPFLAQNGLG